MSFGANNRNSSVRLREQNNLRETEVKGLLSAFKGVDGLKPPSGATVGGNLFADSRNRLAGAFFPSSNSRSAMSNHDDDHEYQIKSLKKLTDSKKRNGGTQPTPSNSKKASASKRVADPLQQVAPSVTAFRRYDSVVKDSTAFRRFDSVVTTTTKTTGEASGKASDERKQFIREQVLEAFAKKEEEDKTTKGQTNLPATSTVAGGNSSRSVTTAGTASSRSNNAYHPGADTTATNAGFSASGGADDALGDAANLTSNTALMMALSQKRLGNYPTKRRSNTLYMEKDSRLSGSGNLVASTDDHPLEPSAADHDDGGNLQEDISIVVNGDEESFMGYPNSNRCEDVKSPSTNSEDVDSLHGSGDGPGPTIRTVEALAELQNAVESFNKLHELKPHCFERASLPARKIDESLQPSSVLSLFSVLQAVATILVYAFDVVVRSRGSDGKFEIIPFDVYQCIFFMVFNSSLPSSLIVNVIAHADLGRETRNNSFTSKIKDIISHPFVLVSFIILLPPIVTHIIPGFFAYLWLTAPILAVGIGLEWYLRTRFTVPSVLLILARFGVRVLILFAVTIVFSLSFNYSVSFIWPQHEFYRTGSYGPSTYIGSIVDDYNVRSIDCMREHIFDTVSNFLQMGFFFL
eukprot:GDKK01067411.1.p1 GENE.GDKK01067411.1~~GDKK01067411.1.p1  ORF type:complete len:740 (-),score=57.91 GDKK01067411.1:66-1967(-)